jgi:hypothetical protein
MGRDGVSTAFSLQKTLSSLYSGGGAEWRDGRLYTMADGAVNVVAEGEVVGRLEAEEDPVTSFTVEGVEGGFPASAAGAATCHRSGLVRVWLDREVVRTFRSIHTGPVAGASPGQ